MSEIRLDKETEILLYYDDVGHILDQHGSTLFEREFNAKVGKEKKYVKLWVKMHGLMKHYFVP